MALGVDMKITTYFAIACALVLSTARPGFAQDLSKVYKQSTLQKDGKRLEIAVRKLFDIGIRPVLTADEK